MIERRSGTILYTTGGSSMDPMAGSAEFTTTAIGSGALRTYALKLHPGHRGNRRLRRPRADLRLDRHRRPRHAARRHRPALLEPLQHPRQSGAALRRFVTQRSM